MFFQSVLCVCTGNICRSPLAEGVLRRDIPALRVASAGIGAVVDGCMPEPAMRIAQRELLDLSDHRGQQINSPLLRAYELILVMESDQRNWLTANFPETRGRVFLVSHWDDGEDVPDPYRHSSEYFDEVFDKLDGYLRAWVHRLAPRTTGAFR